MAGKKKGKLKPSGGVVGKIKGKYYKVVGKVKG
jgi:hypothetical protein